MKKIIYTLMALVTLAGLSSCNKSFPHEGTATESLAGNWYCSIYSSDGSQWVEYYYSEFQTFNTAANVASEIWLDDGEGFWGTKCKIDADASSATFGKEGAEYFDNYNEVKQKIWGGKVSVDAAKAPNSGSVCDKIEFYIAFEDDGTPYETTFYVVGYRRTGYPEDNRVYNWDWELPAVPAE